LKHYLIDKLVCPRDHHFPLDLEIESTSAGPGADLVCDTYCALYRVALKEEVAISPEGTALSESAPARPGKDACLACNKVDIETARLRCPSCGGVFGVEGGIPQLLQELEGTDGADDKQNEIQVRDEQAHKYDSLAMLNLLSKLEIPVTLDLLDAGPEDMVVELGAGTGRLTTKVAAHAKAVIAVDFSVESLMRSKSKCPPGNVDWIQADINRLPLRDGIGDRILSCQVFEHLPGVTVRNTAVDEAARVLKSRGVFVISVYRDSWFWRLWGPKEGYHPGGIYYCRLSGREFENMLGRQFSINRRIPNLGLYLQIAKCVKKAH
jgi:SAM-dependent methyltransferase/uncharacterized protein YbaR (Trm112 family)